MEKLKAKKGKYNEILTEYIASENNEQKIQIDVKDISNMFFQEQEINIKMLSYIPTEEKITDKEQASV